MATQAEAEIVLYDLACNKNTAFSPVVWRIRFMLNYKRIPYRTIFLEFPDINDTVAQLGIEASPPNARGLRTRTVPVIHHIPTSTYMMESTEIAKFIEKTYPDPPVQLDSPLAREIMAKGRAAFGPLVPRSMQPREVKILSPRSQLYFRETREPALGCTLEEMLDPEKEEAEWAAAEKNLRAVGELLLTHRDDGPFIMGAKPSYVDFFVVGQLQCSRVIDEELFQKFLRYPGYGELYEACLPFMDKRD